MIPTVEDIIAERTKDWREENRLSAMYFAIKQHLRLIDQEIDRILANTWLADDWKWGA